ncbi:hypothetical protein B296_00006327 [Ensete ventricosum]|uniref:Uncharacterized protein n=1 Tax=Ensete ventricosum TaxID=4639 RepID=A0A427AKT0_ENSVE|nr:hypothetical protein B296_00006327 [Ensete ventricosum]
MSAATLRVGTAPIASPRASSHLRAGRSRPPLVQGALATVGYHLAGGQAMASRPCRWHGCGWPRILLLDAFAAKTQQERVIVTVKKEEGSNNVGCDCSAASWLQVALVVASKRSLLDAIKLCWLR